MNPEAEGRAAAERFRREHHLGVQPLGDLVAIIEQAAGVDVAVLDVSPDEHGLTMRDPERNAVFIGVACTRHPMRQRSTLAHELGHVLFGDWSDISSGRWADRGPKESRATCFARHLLLPAEGLHEFIGDRRPVTECTLSSIVQRFLVSPAIAAIALRQAGYVDEEAERKWKALTTPQLAVRFGWSDQYRALQVEADQRRAPQRLLARAIQGYLEGVLPAQAIATIRGITREAAEMELRQAGIVPTEHPILWAKPDDLPEWQVDEMPWDADLDASDGHGSSTAAGSGAT